MESGAHFFSVINASVRNKGWLAANSISRTAA